jgi:alpha-glucosidase
VPYLKSVVAEASASGVPAQRPLFLGFGADPRTPAIQDSYLYGPDLLVAPVHRAGAEAWETYLPAGTDWVHLWSGVEHSGGRTARVAARLGQPPVFFRGASRHRALFESAGRL